MTEVDLEVQGLRREVEDLRKEVVKLSKENRKLKADKDSVETLHLLDQSEIVWLRRMIESLVEDLEEKAKVGEAWLSST